MLEDLEFKDGDLELPIEELASRHPMVEAFRHQRSQLPVGQEAIQGLTSNIIAFSLHAGEDRGLTWHHERAGIVWLLASRFHRSGNPEDAYPYFRDLDKRGVLLPTRADLAAWARSQVPTLARSLLSDVPRLRKEAVANPGAVVRGTIGGRIAVRVVQDVDSPPLLTVAISQRLLPGEVSVPPDWLLLVAAAFLPNTRSDRLSIAFDLGGHALGPDEIAFCDFSETDR